MAAGATKPRRTQQERSDATTRQLVASATEQFADVGYAGTSLDAICAAAKVTKGALYHHFDNKQDLFLEVCLQQQGRVIEQERRAFDSKKDPWDGFRAACRAFLDAFQEPGLQRILLFDAPSVLGPDALRRLEADGFEVTAAGLRASMQAKRLPRRPVEPLARLLFGALREAAVEIARADDQQAARRVMVRELNKLLDGLVR